MQSDTKDYLEAMGVILNHLKITINILKLIDSLVYFRAKIVVIHL